MPDQFLSVLLANPYLLLPFALLLVLGLFAALRPGGGKKVNVTDPKVQLACVKKVGFTAQPLLNKSEARVFDAIADTIATHHPGLRLMAQTSLGEVLRPNSGTRAEQSNAFRSINSKRLDFAVFGPDHLLRVGIEYHGSGHNQGNAKARDAVKRAVFERAGIPLIELPAKVRPADVETALLRALAAPGTDRGANRAEPPVTRPEAPLQPGALGPAIR